MATRDSADVRSGCLLGAASAGAWVLPTIGFLSPLTPSEGNLGWIEILIFVGGPLVLLAGVASKTRRWWAWVGAGIQMALIIAISIWLLTSIWQ